MSTWDFRKNSVQDVAPEVGSHLGSKAVLISFGPPKIDQVTEGKLAVCGFVQNMNMSQQKNVQQLFEIGSGRRYYVDGPTQNMVSIARAMFSGPTIMKLMGAGLTRDDVAATESASKLWKDSSVFAEREINSVASSYDSAYWINLSSSFFQNPMGIMLRYKTIRGDGKNPEETEDFGGVYLQNCKLTSHSTQVTAGQWLMHENVQLMFEEAIPIDGVSVDSYETERTNFANGVIGKS